MMKKLPPLNDKYVHALSSFFLRFPDKKLPIYVGGRDKYLANRGKPSRRRASVFVPLCNRHGVPSVLFTKRTNTVGSHKGHVSFPGGHQDADESAEAAALREFREELFSTSSEIDDVCDQVKVIGECQTIPALTGTIVTPIVGYLERDVGDLSCFAPDNNEVASVFTRSLVELLSDGSRRTQSYSHNGERMTLPVWGETDDEERIWGLTACILEAVLDKLINPIIYSKTGLNKVGGSRAS